MAVMKDFINVEEAITLSRLEVCLQLLCIALHCAALLRFASKS